MKGTVYKQYIKTFIVQGSMKYLALFISLAILPSAYAMTLEETQDSIAHYHSRILKTTVDAERLQLSENMRNLFIASFNNPQVFDFPFEKLRFCTITSSDKRVRLFNWNVPFVNGTHTYFCFVLVKNEKKSSFEWTELKCIKNEPENLEGQVLKQNKWPGALYYDIIPMDKKKNDKYTLLGWDGKDNLSTRKVIEIMTISGKNNIRFGDDVFKEDKISSRKRIIMEYSDEVSVTLKYYPEQQCIVMDELAPKNPVMGGIYSEYGPFGSYNMLQLKKGNWELHKNIDASKFAPNEGRPWNDPAKIRSKP